MLAVAAVAVTAKVVAERRLQVVFASEGREVDDLVDDHSFENQQ